MGVVVEFPSANNGASEPDEGIVSIIEGLLERARADEVQTFVLGTADPEGHPLCETAMDKGHATTMIVAETRIISALETVENSSSD